MSSKNEKSSRFNAIVERVLDLMIIPVKFLMRLIKELLAPFPFYLQIIIVAAVIFFFSAGMTLWFKWDSFSYHKISSCPQIQSIQKISNLVVLRALVSDVIDRSIAADTLKICFVYHGSALLSIDLREMKFSPITEDGSIDITLPNIQVVQEKFYNEKRKGSDDDLTYVFEQTAHGNLKFEHAYRSLAQEKVKLDAYSEENITLAKERTIQILEDLIKPSGLKPHFSWDTEKEKDYRAQLEEGVQKCENELRLVLPALMTVINDQYEIYKKKDTEYSESVKALESQKKRSQFEKREKEIEELQAKQRDLKTLENKNTFPAKWPLKRRLLGNFGKKNFLKSCTFNSLQDLQKEQALVEKELAMLRSELDSGKQELDEQLSEAEGNLRKVKGMLEYIEDFKKVNKTALKSSQSDEDKRRLYERFMEGIHNRK